MAWSVVEAVAMGLAEDALGEGRGVGVGVAGGGGFDGGVEGDRAGVAYGGAIAVTGFGGPEATELGLAGAGRPVGLFGGAPLGFG